MRSAAWRSSSLCGASRSRRISSRYGSPYLPSHWEKGSREGIACQGTWMGTRSKSRIEEPGCQDQRLKHGPSISAPGSWCIPAVYHRNIWLLSARQPNRLSMKRRHACCTSPMHLPRVLTAPAAPLLLWRNLSQRISQMIEGVRDHMVRRGDLSLPIRTTCQIFEEWQSCERPMASYLRAQKD